MKYQASSLTRSRVQRLIGTTSIPSMVAQARALRESYRAWCEQCVEVVVALTPESAVGLLRIPSDALYGLLQNGKLHAVEVGARPPLVCCNSLSCRSADTQMRIKGEGK